MKYQCKICSLPIKKKKELYRHMKMEHRKIWEMEKKFTCDYCGKLLAYKHSLKYHINMHMLRAERRRNTNTKDETQRAENSENEGNTSRSSRTKDDYYYCNLCDARFTYDFNLEAHRKKKHPNSVWTKNNSKYECDYCKKTFKRRRDVEVHIIAHMKRTYNCSKCTRSFIDDEKLKRHEQLHLRDESQQLKCEICSEVYETLCVLNDHKAMHGEKIFTCEICDKTFKTQWILNYHINDHKGKTFSCDYCNNKFRRKNSIYPHVKHFHPERAEEYRQNKLKTDYPCEHCEAKFDQKKDLLRHMKREHLEKIRSRRLNMTLGKNFPCDYCPTSYKQKFNLNIHIKKCHPEVDIEMKNRGRRWPNVLINQPGTSHQNFNLIDYELSMRSDLNFRNALLPITNNFYLQTAPIIDSPSGSKELEIERAKPTDPLSLEDAAKINRGIEESINSQTTVCHYPGLTTTRPEESPEAGCSTSTNNSNSTKEKNFSIEYLLKPDNEGRK